MTFVDYCETIKDIAFSTMKGMAVTANMKGMVSPNSRAAHDGFVV